MAIRARACASIFRIARRESADRWRRYRHREFPPKRSRDKNPCGTSNNVGHIVREPRQRRDFLPEFRYQYCSSLNKTFLDLRREAAPALLLFRMRRYFEIQQDANPRKTPCTPVPFQSLEYSAPAQK